VEPLSTRGACESVLTILLSILTVCELTATITSKGQITIPLGIRRHLGLKTGDKLEFDENAPILIARRAVDRTQWRATVGAWRKATSEALKGHPWADAGSSALIDDLRGGPIERAPSGR